MRLTAVALIVLAVSGSATGAGAGPRVGFVHDGQLVVANLATGSQQVVLKQAALGTVAWSGDGKLISDAGRIAGGPTLPTTALSWSPTGETAIFIATDGSVRLWSPSGGQRTILPQSWGAHSVAFGSGGRIALGRKIYGKRPAAAHEEVWMWQNGNLHRIAGPLKIDTTPIVEGFAPDGDVLWWSDGYDSSSIAADGLPLYANGKLLGQTLVFPDFVDTCGTHLVFARGNDRYTTHGKSIIEDGRDISNDTKLSWVSPSCNGATVVAAAGRNWAETLIGRGELRSLWQLEPTRKRLTHPPSGWTDEDPHVLSDGSILFVRTHQTIAMDATTEHASLDLLRQGTLKAIASMTITVNDLSSRWEPNYYGHYGWPSLIAVAP